MHLNNLMKAVVLSLLVLSAVPVFALPDQVSAVSVSGITLQRPVDIAVSGTGPSRLIYVADQAAHAIYKIDASGVGSVFAGIPNTAGYSADSTSASTVLATASHLNEPTGVAVDSSGNVYIADSLNHRIRKVDSSGAIWTVAGTGTPGTGANQLFQPTGVSVDSAGSVYIADNGNYLVRKLSNGSLTTVAGDGSAKTLTPFRVAALPTPGDLYISDPGNNLVYALYSGKLTKVAGDGVPGYTGDGGDALKARLTQPSGVAVDGSKNIYISDPINNTIRKITVSSAGVTNVIATRVGNSTDLKLEAAVPAALSKPLGMAFDAAGNLLIVCHGSTTVSEVGASVSAITTPSPIGGSIAGGSVDVSLTSSRTVQAVYYTLDGTSPKTSATRKTYSGPITISSSTILKFYSLDLSGNQETISTATYAIPVTVTAAPVPGSFNVSPLSVTLSAAPSATIHYTTDGSAPSLTSAVYAAPISILSTSTIKYFAVDSIGNQTNVAQATYLIDTVAPTTTAVPDGSVPYRTDQTITLTTNDSTAAIYYTVNGSTPTATVSNKYTKPIVITATTTLKYFAVDAAGNQEAVKTIIYTIDKTAPKTTATPAAGAYKSAQSITLTANETSAIYYTTDGSVPTTASSVFTLLAPITLGIPNTTTTIRFFAVDTAGNTEGVQTLIYRYDTTAPATTIDVAGTTSTTPLNVTVTASEADATIYYTTDGKAPTPATTTKAVGTVTVRIDKSLTLQYFAMDPAGNMETSVHTQTYVIDTTAPTTSASLKDGIYTSAQTVTLTSNDAGATIYYTIDGTVPSTSSQKYSSPIAIDRDTVLKYFSRDSLGNSESVKTNTYSIITLTTAATPPGGVFAKNQTITLTSNLPTATIKYTLDGTDPKTSVSAKTYSDKSKILITDVTTATSKTTILQFYAEEKNGIIESVKSELYTIDTAVPTTTMVCPAAGSGANLVKFTASDPGDPLPRIKYSANTPTNNGSAIPAYTLADYTNQVTYSGNTIFRFFAYDEAGNVESIKIGYCTDVVSVTANPSLYLETLATGTATPSSALYVHGYAAPFGSATVTVNGISITPAPADGAFSTSLSTPLTADTLTVIATSGASTTTETRTITQNAAASSATMTIGNGMGVSGSRIRVPLSLSSGYQSAGVTFDVRYDHTKLSIMDVEFAPIVRALGKNVLGEPLTSGDYRVVVMDIPGGGVSALPEGVLAYAVFTVVASAGTDSVSNAAPTTSRATDVGAAAMLNVTTINGTASLIRNPGDSNADGTTTIAELLQGLYMLIDPVTYPPSGAFDLNGDGVVSLLEVQQAINAYVKQ